MGGSTVSNSDAIAAGVSRFIPLQIHQGKMFYQGLCWILPKCGINLQK
ncbi:MULTISPECIES: hypothetical protein [unclassified Nostoc]|nr:hypothetical protein [Nostoc sp. DedQUE03]MDZ7971436.1 hypothetical protein [Nostoc sp. DedQUE03]MDZ8046293.1 hypothetical protein [Nostoc sp. DedQUE02]